MKNKLIELENKFTEIKKLGWIEASSHGNGNVGITFENMLGKERENFPIADYNGIEIKTFIKGHGRPYITLFSSAPDGKYIFQTQILKEKYGKQDWKIKTFKVFYARITANKFTKINNNYYMKLKIDYNREKIFLEIYDLNFKLIEKDCYWDFTTIQNKIKQKLKYLAYITAEKKFSHNKVYFRYIDINFYKIKNFKCFLQLIAQRKIKICFKVGIYRTKQKLGKTYDHGTGFEIKKENILELYEKI